MLVPLLLAFGGCGGSSDKRNSHKPNDEASKSPLGQIERLS